MTRFYLLLSAAGLLPIALSYGVAPETVLPTILDLTVEGTDQVHIFRAVMGLYMGMITLWVVGAFKSDFSRAAVIAEVFFMLGLATGRILSIIVDGMPSTLLVAYTIVEIVMGAWGVQVLKALSTGPTRDGSSEQ